MVKTYEDVNQREISCVSSKLQSGCEAVETSVLLIRKLSEDC